MSARTYLTGLIGEDIAGSLSPSLHNVGFAALGVTGLYQPIDTAARGLTLGELGDLLNALRATGFDGFNVTHPFKTAILPYLDDITPDALALGAVNTVVIREGRLIGHNTDWQGFAAQFRTFGEDASETGPVLVLGAGGAGRAVIYALTQAGVVDIRLYDPDNDRAAELAVELATGQDHITVVDDPTTAAAEAGVIVNASTTGMNGTGGLPLAADALQAHHGIADVVYFPLETPLIVQARATGCRVATGDIMCFEQALAAFEIMTGLTPDRTAMARHFAELLSAAA